MQTLVNVAIVVEIITICVVSVGIWVLLKRAWSVPPKTNTTNVLIYKLKVSTGKFEEDLIHPKSSHQKQTHQKDGSLSFKNSLRNELLEVPC